MRPADNLLVLKTPPGAQCTAAAVDSERLRGVAGTIGGDDTVLVITPSRAARTADATSPGGHAPTSTRNGSPSWEPPATQDLSWRGCSSASRNRKNRHFICARILTANVNCLTEIFPQLRGWGEAPAARFPPRRLQRAAPRWCFWPRRTYIPLELVPKPARCRRCAWWT